MIVFHYLLQNSLLRAIVVPIVWGINFFLLFFFWGGGVPNIDLPLFINYYSPDRGNTHRARLLQLNTVSLLTFINDVIPTSR